MPITLFPELVRIDSVGRVSDDAGIHTLGEGRQEEEGTPVVDSMLGCLGVVGGGQGLAMLSLGLLLDDLEGFLDRGSFLDLRVVEVLGNEDALGDGGDLPTFDFTASKFRGDVAEGHGLPGAFGLRLAKGGEVSDRLGAFLPGEVDTEDVLLQFCFPQVVLVQVTQVGNGELTGSDYLVIMHEADPGIGEEGDGLQPPFPCDEEVLLHPDLADQDRVEQALGQDRVGEVLLLLLREDAALAILRYDDLGELNDWHGMLLKS